MKLILSYILTPVHYFFFGLVLLIFHPIQMVALNVFGSRAHRKTVEALNFLLLLNFGSLLSRVSVKGVKQLPANRPLIVVSNHQSMFDSPPIIWSFRKHDIHFISKKELGKGLPSISYFLRKGGSVLIDRDNREEAIASIALLGTAIEREQSAVCIFAEGTRNKAGKMRPFKPGGIKTLLDNSPNALVVPFVIHDNYKLHKRGYFPLGIGLHLRFSALEPIERAGHSYDDLIALIEQQIKHALGQG